MRSWDLNIFHRDDGNGDGGGGEGLDLYRDQARAPPVFERPKCREEAGLCEEKAE